MRLLKFFINIIHYYAPRPWLPERALHVSSFPRQRRHASDGHLQPIARTVRLKLCDGGLCGEFLSVSSQFPGGGRTAGEWLGLAPTPLHSGWRLVPTPLHTQHACCFNSSSSASTKAAVVMSVGKASASNVFNFKPVTAFPAALWGPQWRNHREAVSTHRLPAKPPLPCQSGKRQRCLKTFDGLSRCPLGSMMAQRQRSSLFSGRDFGHMTGQWRHKRRPQGRSLERVTRKVHDKQCTLCRCMQPSPSSRSASHSATHKDTVMSPITCSFYLA